MALVIKDSGSGNFADVPNIGNGQYPARVVQIVDMGVQRMEVYGKPDEMEEKPVVRITYEFSTKRIDITKDGVTESRPRWLGKDYKVSKDERGNLRKAVDNILPGFDWEGDSDITLIAGKACMVAVGTTSGGKDKIVATNAAIEGFEVGELENPVTIFDLSDPSLDDFNVLPQWIQTKIEGSVNIASSPLLALKGLSDEDIPY